MIMAQVIGSVVSTQKDTSLIGKKLMVIRQVNSEKKEIRYEQIAIDTVGAGVGDFVLVTSGSSARKIIGEESGAVDLAIVGIIDTFDK
ncbi:EutN/CcmL family microcompartment protein [Vagococcus carniphilus]|uniref:Ethanolamine utilization protein EutN n=1 Tax=Vagococcus carniphilus TaxID=218144 RepID=A0A430AXF4_9ENTE|nr:EutN/CcmL family microcompartment protein [Vagococcus carniphilus]MDT2815434.1 EutN/CcmL family microcompartment protein [Vagococcus carniphilus]MDT2830744.1 EutN/CcmL family microcompartment protein [Vagococcus carniphilus]MDT2833047.1 EutN/CcmL family microcompartment protein [Vagococcus carniphilus]MDT2839484.1 EutN/CcmL family microcompartment protein [Vagococcus carniphilus]MDT2848497.1 EutN/CcmL family microcompartment protein [Vagococcus carniphilus]